MRRRLVDNDFLRRRQHDSAISPFHDGLTETFMPKHCLTHGCPERLVDGSTFIEESFNIRSWLTVRFRFHCWYACLMAAHFSAS
jgi:hypothetical protein